MMETGFDEWPAGINIGKDGTVEKSVKLFCSVH
jgi:hypothetical protein